MKKFITPTFIVTGLLVALFLGLLFIAETNPFSAEHAHYPLQLTAENLRTKLTHGKEPQAELALELADRRLANLASAKDPLILESLVDVYQRSLQVVQQRLTDLPAEKQAEWQQRFSNHLLQAEIVALSFDNSYQQLLLSDLDHYTRELALPNVVENEFSPEIRAVPVPFLGRTVEHENFELADAHSELECTSCHINGVYANTPTLCGSCHDYREESDRYFKLASGLYFPDNIDFTNPYPDHFSGDCDQCHTAVDWEPYQFDHADVVECQSCHLDDLPQAEHVLATRNFLASYYPAFYGTDVPLPTDGSQHYPGDCNLCHTGVSDWTEIEYQHIGVRDCESCHLNETPADHYPGACLRCHDDTSDWSIYIFDHTGFTDCLNCHRAEAPYQHYSGLCSACHTTDSWLPAFFNHQGYTDCRSCHSSPDHYRSQCSSCHNSSDWFKTTLNHDRFTNCDNCHTAPQAHYPGQCSECHSNQRWNRITFSHATHPDCQSCHDNLLPAAHYSGTCSNCHNTGSWEQALFSHTGQEDCQGCHTAPAQHFPGDCASCHNTNTWLYASFNHTGFYDCQNCHAVPGGHYPVPCVACHNSGAWFDINFDHSGYTDCLSCHIRPEAHFPADCQDCHVTTSWYQTSYTHDTSLACSDCHAAPDGHWQGECSNCHVVTSWDVVHFDHTGYTNCSSCHIRPSGHAHGQCSRCHVTDGWSILPPTPTPTPTELPVDSGSETNPGILSGYPIPSLTPTRLPPLPTPAPYLP